MHSQFHRAWKAILNRFPFQFKSLTVKCPRVKQGERDKRETQKTANVNRLKTKQVDI